MTSSALINFFIMLAEDPDALAGFEDDPAGAVRGVLSDDQLGLILSRDQRAIRLALVAEHEAWMARWLAERASDAAGTGLSREISRPGKGALTAVGTGIRSLTQITTETRAAIRAADKVFYMAADPITPSWMVRQNSRVEFLNSLIEEGKHRETIYREITDRFVQAVQDGWRVCLVIYGHPGVFSFATHRAVRQVREMGRPAVMLPAVSAEDSLFADLGVDAGPYGCHSFEGDDFLLHRRSFDPRSSLLIWQIGVIGQPRLPNRTPIRRSLRMVSERLLEHYPADHLATVYEAAVIPGCPPRIDQVRLRSLEDAAMTSISTLYVPPLPQEEGDLVAEAQLPAPPR
ncbi:SAM-dependent methyltransferase [Streptomyces sp. NPDC057909]|uniref:SAM-dependent methyltransferase n=1 Tax=Streptomyces sp. NPDC057909 TaxID=3346277 RepID=UPI0036E3C7B6